MGLVLWEVGSEPATEIMVYIHFRHPERPRRRLPFFSFVSRRIWRGSPPTGRILLCVDADDPLPCGRRPHPELLGEEVGGIRLDQTRARGEAHFRRGQSRCVPSCSSCTLGSGVCLTHRFGSGRDEGISAISYHLGIQID